VLEALGKKAGPEDDRTEGQRFHDALQLACAPLPRVPVASVTLGFITVCAASTVAVRFL
jgi:hypothetical protein